MFPHPLSDMVKQYRVCRQELLVMVHHGRSNPEQFQTRI